MEKQKIIAISGCTGQLGSIALEEALRRGWFVYGLKRRSSNLNTQRIDHVFNHPNLKLIYGDLTDAASIIDFVSTVHCDYYCNFAAQSFVPLSFNQPIYTMDTTGTGVFVTLEALRKYSPRSRYVNLASSEIFGSAKPPQSEITPPHPRSPYAIAKLASYWATINYREAYNLFASNAILFNSESERRGENFVTRKVVLGAVRCKLGLQDKLKMGNTSAQRNWNSAYDTVDAIFRILLADEPDDYVVASGEMHSVQQLIELVFSRLDLDWKKYVEIDPLLFRPAEVDALCGDSTKIRTKLGWEPKISFDELINKMIAHDLDLARKEKLLLDLNKSSIDIKENK